MREKIFKQRYYKHIDKVLNINHVIKNVKNKNYIVQHGFYPFISYTLTYKKFCEEIDFDSKHHWKAKNRPIKYASHIDRCIYQWYSHLINNSYNVYCKNSNLEMSVIAYRTNLKGMTNINFARIAFDFIKETNACYVIVSDFSNFFDNIEHDVLKKNLCEVLNTTKLEEDVYKVYRSMTKYSYIERKDIEEYLIKNKIENKQSLKNLNSYFDNVKWSSAKKDLKDKILINDKNYGIPQGSPLSGIFANIYMINFDKELSNYCLKHNGLYMRYSDDLILIIPKKEVENIGEIWKKMTNVKKMYDNLVMNVDKTSGYLYENKKIISLHNEVPGMKKSNNVISYLGFSFDGKYIKFRDKTLTKFYYKLYRKIDDMKEREKDRITKGKKRKTKINKTQIFDSVFKQNENKRKYIDYVKKSKKIFYDEKYIMNFEDRVKEKIFKRFS